MEFEGGLAKQKEIESETWEKAVANAREQANKTLKAIKYENRFGFCGLARFISINPDRFLR